MKRCPNCSIEYFDMTLEFCLEDGTRLVHNSTNQTETPTINRVNKLDLPTEKTVNLPYSQPANFTEKINQNFSHPLPKTILTNEKTISQQNQILEIIPFVIALAHNWWQWIYLNNQYYSSFSSYVLSANFLMWLLLLAVGTILGLLGIKRCQVKTFSIASLVILSINLILFIVPKR
jgi:hypothetical protein